MMYAEAVTRKLIPADGLWHPIFQGDNKTDPTGAAKIQPDGSLAFPDAAMVLGQLYVNVSGNLAADFTDGQFDIQAVRTGTTNDTANDYRLVRSANRTPGGFYVAKYTSPLWVGARPAGFRWELRVPAGGNLRSAYVQTRHVKHYGVVLTK